MQSITRPSGPEPAVRSASAIVSSSGPRENDAVSPKKPNLDQLHLSQEAPSDLKTQAEQLLNQLKEAYPELHFQIVPDDKWGDLKELAAQLGHGKHLVISEGFLDRMVSSREDFLACRGALLKSVLLLSADGADGVFLEEKQAVSWNVQPSSPSRPGSALPQPDPYQSVSQLLESLDQREGTSPGSTDYRGKLSKTASNTSGLYTRLAQANSKRAVLSVMSDAQRNIASLRLTSCFGSTEDQIRARKAIRSLQKLLLRGNQKNRRLNQENLLKIRKRRAEEKQQEAKALKIQLELKRRKTARKSVDNAIFFEGQQEEREIRRLRRYLSCLEYSPAAPMGTGSIDMGISAPAGGSAPVSAENISVSEPMSF